jgi:hypothetical protein
MLDVGRWTFDVRVLSSSAVSAFQFSAFQRFRESGIRASIQSPIREADGLSRLHNTITDWPDSGYTRRIAFIPGAPPP